MMPEEVRLPWATPEGDELRSIIGGGLPSLQVEESRPWATQAGNELRAIIGQSQWSDDRYSAESRLNHFLTTHRNADRPFAEIAPDLQQRFGVDASKFEKQYEQERKIGAAKRRQAGEGESTFEFFARRSMPGGSAIGGAARSLRYGSAMARRAKGEATDEDAEVIARYERLKEIDNETTRTTGGAIGDSLAHIPAIVGESMLLPGARQAILGKQAVEAGAGKFAEQQAARGFLNRQAHNLPGLAAQTATMPSMYAAQGAEKMVEHPGMSPTTAFGSSFVYGMAQTAVLGRLAGAADRQGKGILPWAGTIAGRTPLGMAEQQIVDVGATGIDHAMKAVLGHTVGLDTRGGLGGYLLRGETDEFMKHAAVQGATFAVFAAMHRRVPGFEESTGEKFKPGALRDTFHDYFRTSEKEGISKQDAAKRFLNADAEFLDAFDRGLIRSREEGREFIKDFPDAIRPHLEARLEALPITLKTLPEPAGAGPEWARVARDAGVASKSLRRLGQREQAAPKVEEPTPAKRLGPVGPEPRHPALDVLAPQELADIAKQLGLPATGKPETVLARLLQAPGVAPLVDAAVRSKAAPAGRQTPSAPAAPAQPAPPRRLGRTSPLDALTPPELADLAASKGATVEQLQAARFEPWVATAVSNWSARNRTAAPTPAATPPAQPAPQLRLSKRPADEPAPSAKERRIDRKLQAATYESIPSDLRARVEGVIGKSGHDPAAMREVARLAFASRKGGQHGLTDLLQVWEQKIAGRRLGDKPVDLLQAAARKLADAKFAETDPAEALKPGELLTAEDRAWLERTRAKLRTEPEPEDVADARRDAESAGLAEGVPDAKVRRRVDETRRDSEEAGAREAAEVMARGAGDSTRPGAEAQAPRSAGAVERPTVEKAIGSLNEMVQLARRDAASYAFDPPRIDALLRELAEGFSDAELKQIATEFTGAGGRGRKEALRRIWFDLTGTRRMLESQETNWTAKKLEAFGQTQFNESVVVPQKDTFEGSEGVLFFGGSRPTTATGGAGKPGTAAGPYEVIETAKQLFGVTRSVGRVTGGAQGAYLPYVRWLESQSRKAGNVEITAHEIAHHIATEGKFETDPAKLPPDVREGLRSLDYKPSRTATKLSMAEGMAEYFRRRLAGDLANLTPEQQAAARHVEQWLAEKGYKDRADRVQKMFGAFRSMDPTTRAATLISPTGQPATAAGLTTGEAMAKTWDEAAKDATDAWIDRLAPAVRMEEVRLKVSGRELPKGEDLRSVLATVVNSGGNYADEMAAKGAFTFEAGPDGVVRKVRLSEGAMSLLDGLQHVTAKDLEKPRGPRRLGGLLRGQALGSSRIGTYLLGRSVVNETQRGAEMVEEGKRLEGEAQARGAGQFGRLNSPWMDQLREGQRLQREGAVKLASADEAQVKAFKEMLDQERTQNPDWAREAEEVARRYTALHNAASEALVRVGFMDREHFEKMKAEYPDYVPFHRVVEGSEFRLTLGTSRSGSGRQFVDPLHSLHAKFVLTGHLLSRQLADNALWKSGEVDAGPRGVAEFWKEVPEDVAATPREVNLREVEATLEALGVPPELRAEMLTGLPDAALSAFAAPAWSQLGKNERIIRVDGKPVRIEFADRGLYEVMSRTQGNDSRTVNFARVMAKVPVMAWFNRLLKSGATRASATFSLVRNPIRDPWAFAQNVEKQAGPLQHVFDYLGGAADAGKRGLEKVAGREASDPRMALYEEAGGESLRALGGLARPGEGDAAWRTLEDRGGRLKEGAIAVANRVDKVIEALGFMEHAGRFAEFKSALEEMGYTREKIEAAMKAHPNESPIPLNVLVYARQRAARATTDFTRQGSVAAEWTKIAPFFSAHIAGLSQEAGNWRQAAKELREGKLSGKVKVMGGGLALYTALEVYHWLTFSDDDWYKELPSHLRTGYWVLGRRPDGGVWGIPKPQGVLRMWGANLQESLRAESDSNAKPGEALKATAEMLTPRVAPVGVGEAFDIASNRGWSGKPIVSDRDERRMTEKEQWLERRLPYLVDQLSGGLSTGRGFSGSPLAVSKVEPHQSVEDFYDRLQEVEKARLKARDAGSVFAGEAEYQRLSNARERIELLNVELRGQRRLGSRNMPGTPPTPERVRQIQQLKVYISRNALQSIK